MRTTDLGILIPSNDSMVDIVEQLVSHILFDFFPAIEAMTLVFICMGCFVL